MKFIIDTFEKDNRQKVATAFNGEVVHENENLVIVESDDEYLLHKQLREILNDVFRVEEYKGD